jgi:23S rRNA (uracil1939-C5)-methyltransferase
LNLKNKYVKNSILCAVRACVGFSSFQVKEGFMQKNSLYTGVVIAMGTNGEGVVKVGDEVAFVPACLTGETVTFLVLAVKGGVAYGKVVRIENPSPHRVQEVCPVCAQCGGCQLQHADYDFQLQFKREQVANTLKKIGGIEAEVQPTVAGEKCLRYRNKLALPIGVDEKGNTVVGFYAERSHRIVPISDCPIQAEWVKNVISAVLAFAKKSGYTGYNEQTRKGELRHIVVREVGGKFIVVLVAAKPIQAKPLVAFLAESFSSFTLWLNINGGTGNGVFGKEMRLVHGEGFYQAEDCGITFKAGANTFLQVNDGVRTKLYQAVVKGAKEDNSVVLDLYSGGGMLTAMLAKNAEQAYGVEIVPEASACADELKELNGLSEKMHNVCGKVEEKIDEIFAATVGKRRVVVCDPPRKGMERSVIKAILRAKPDKIVLVSCNPSTLARDLGLLIGTLTEQDGQLIKTTTAQGGQSVDTSAVQGGKNAEPCVACGAGEYQIESITPFDMFPQTKHCEVVVALSLK